MLKATYNQAIKDFSAVLDYPWHSPEFYAAWCAQTYFYTRHATRILLLGSAQTKMNSPQLHRRLSAHAGEEKGHETLAKSDAKDLGFTPEQIGEFAATRGFYSHQYYTIQHVSVESLFGFILGLEGLASVYGKPWIERIQAKSKAPHRFLSVHADEDPGHIDLALKTINGFDAVHLPDIIANLEFTVDTYFQILESCNKFAEKKGYVKAS